MEPTSAPVPQSSPAPVSVPAPLRGPMEILRSSWVFFKAHWKILASVAIIPPLVSFIGVVLSTIGAPVIFIAPLFFIAAPIIGIAMYPALIKLIGRLQAEPGAPVSVRGQYKIGFSYFWSLLFVVILQVLITFGSAVLLIIPALIVGVFASMYMFALVVDDKKGFSAFTESYSLVRGRWAGVFGRILFAALVYAIVGLIIAGIVFLIQSIFSLSANSEGGFFVSSVLNLVSGAIVGPWLLVYLYHLYVSLKSSRAPGIATSAFKKWLVAFICIAVIAVLMIPVIGGVIGYRYIQDFSASALKNVPSIQK